ncbi:unnamed protein product [Tuber melanosporum]|uniref:(Perigord truffle) hypothetical protein n=1 Tax=Tuber melanosporum (strain Mel28) TaxID=656061 RepID=D5GHI5_TUBMM|nr:uncharacterized protein GSTUM_00007932001 [Tuber melanosporum]CAZ83978.1 unnamed protein product [Tuber melanosporum]
MGNEGMKGGGCEGGNPFVITLVFVSNMMSTTPPQTSAPLLEYAEYSQLRSPIFSRLTRYMHTEYVTPVTCQHSHAS